MSTREFETNAYEFMIWIYDPSLPYFHKVYLNPWVWQHWSWPIMNSDSPQAKKNTAFVAFKPRIIFFLKHSLNTSSLISPLLLSKRRHNLIWRPARHPSSSFLSYFPLSPHSNSLNNPMAHTARIQLIQYISLTRFSPHLHNRPSNLKY